MTRVESIKNLINQKMKSELIVNVSVISAKLEVIDVLKSKKFESYHRSIIV